jgi:hypothetical protein
MNAICDAQPNLPNLAVSIIHMDTNERKTEKFENLPNDIKYKPRLLKCDNTEKTVMVPVAEIRVSPLDNSGKLVKKEAATSMLIEYIDKEGHVLQVVRMEKQ